MSNIDAPPSASYDPVAQAHDLYIDMPSGIAGDMLMAALLDAGANLTVMLKELEGLGLGEIQVKADRVSPSGIAATQVP